MTSLISSTSAALIVARVLELALTTAWQGVVLFALATLAIRFGPTLTTATRHRLWWGTLLLALIAPAVFRRFDASHVSIAVPESVTTSTGARIPAPTKTDSSIRSPLADASLVLTEAPLSAAAPAVPNLTIAPTQGLLIAIAAVWLAVALFLLQRIVRGLRAVRRLRDGARPADLSTVAALSPRLRAHFRTPDNIALLTSYDVSVPVALGFHIRAVVLPAHMAAALDATQLQHVVLHELAHLVRRDDWGTLALRVLHALFFFLPVVPLAMRRIELEQEMACDDWALDQARADAADYAASLLRVGELALAGIRAPRRTMALLSSADTQLARRIGRLLARRSVSTSTEMRVPRWRWLVLPLPLIAMGTLGAALPRLAVVPPVVTKDSAPAMHDSGNVEGTASSAAPESTTGSESTVASSRASNALRAPREMATSNTGVAIDTSPRASLPVRTFHVAMAQGTRGLMGTAKISSPMVTAPVIPMRVPQVDTSRIVDRRTIKIPSRSPLLPASQMADSLASLQRTLAQGDADARARASYALSLWREYSSNAIPLLLGQLADTTPVVRTNGTTSVAWWDGETRARTSPSEEAAKALLFIGRQARAPLAQFMAEHPEVAEGRTTFALRLLKQFD